MTSSAIIDKLVFLYGEPTARTIEPRWDEMLRKYSNLLGKTRRENATRLSERDALLITYPNQVREPGASPLQTLKTLLDTHLSTVVSGVHLLPFFPYSSDDGFSVEDYRAVDPAFGTWDGVTQLGQHFDLMFDAVINHVSARSKWFQRFLQDDPTYRDFFIVVDGNPDLSRVARPRALPLLTEFETPSGEKKVWTTFSADQVDLNYRNPNVLLAILDILLFYVERGARFIRLDAIAYLWKEIGTPCIHLPQTHTIIQLMRAVLDEVAPWVMLITETNVPHAENISYFGEDKNEAQLVYNFALPPLVLHAFHTGDAIALARWAQTLSLPSDRATYFNFLASHDGIGINPVRGILSVEEIDALVARTQEHGGFVSNKQNADGTVSPYELNINYFDALSNPNDSTEPLFVQINRFIAAQAIMLSLVGVPGIYFHSLFGSRGDRAGAETAGIPRRINRRKFTRHGLESDLANPDSLRAQVFASYAKLLRVRRAHRAFDPNGLQHVVPCDESIFAVLRVAPDSSERVLCLHNVSNSMATVRLGRNWNGEVWKDLVTGREYRADKEDIFAFALEPFQVVWAQQQSEMETLVSRVTRTKKQAQRTYDRISRWYDWIAGSEKKYVAAGLARLAVKEGEQVLELGCGAGYASAELARIVGEQGTVVSLDLSQGMLQRAQARVREAGLSRRVMLCCCDAAHPGFNADSFDAVFMSFTLDLFDTPEIPLVLRECHRVLRHAGRISVVALSKQAKTNWPMRLYEWLHRTFPTLVDCRPILVQRALEEAGFKVSDPTHMTLWGMPIAIVLATKESKGV